MRESSLSNEAQSLFQAAIRRVQADQLLTETDWEAWADARQTEYDRISVVGMGKAAMAMAGVLEARAPEDTEGVVVVPEGYPASYPERLPAPSSVRVMEGGHPLPTQGSVRAARRLLETARDLEDNDLLLALISGGGTALSSLPVEDLDLPDLKTTYHRLLAAGVPIQPANVVRKHLTQVGGGQLAKAAYPGGVMGLVVSDVPGNDPATIASGPTVPDPSTYEQAMQVLYRHELWHDVPESVREHLAGGARGRQPETPNAEAGCFDTTETRLIGRNETALDAAQAAAEEQGYRVHVETEVEGESRDVGRAHVRDMLAADVDEPTCWLWGGETTVTVTGDGTGGRNQEVALGAALELEGTSENVLLLSGGTDGIDGPTDAAGAWATPGTGERARAAGHDPLQHLKDNNAYPLFEAIDQLLRPGPTHTNVMDVHIGLVRPD